MELNEEDRKTLVNLRLDNARSTLREVELLLQNSLWRTAANRMYYACYYAAGALFVKNGLTTHTHSGIISQLGLHFVSKGIISMKQGKLYKDLFELRQTGDYDDWITIEENDIAPLLVPAQEFIATIEKLISTE